MASGNAIRVGSRMITHGHARLRCTARYHKIPFVFATFKPIGALGSVGYENGATTFEAFELSSCGLPELVASIPAEFDFRTAPLPGLGPDAGQPRSTGAKLAAFHRTAGEECAFAHYDGYDVRIFHVTPNATAWDAKQVKVHVHDTRHDFAAPAPG
jgi:hypothetical protein